MGARTYVRPTVTSVRVNRVQRGWLALACGGRKRHIEPTA